MTIYDDNSAGRLYRVLDDLRKVQPDTLGIREGWAQIMGTNDITALSRRMMEVFQLPTKVELEIQQLDDEEFDRDFVMRWWEPVQKTFSGSLFAAGQVRQTMHYDSASLASLETCSYLLHRFRREAMPTEDDLETVRRLISEIEELVAVDGDINQDLRDFLSAQARAMRIAVDDFKFTGAPAIEDAVDQAIGAAIRRGYILESADEEAAEGETGSKSALKKFWAMIGRAALVLSMTANILALGQTVHSDLTSHPHRSPAIESVTSSPDSSHPGQTTIELAPARSATHSDGQQ